MGTYSYSSKTQLSTHFNVTEFRCKCGRVHDTKVDSSLITMLERLIKKLNADKCYVESGYRCTAHDKAVGGNGYGAHTTGLAADVRFYDKSGNVIPTDIVSCVAQDLGFIGIANINSNMTNIHLDMKQRSSRYLGDERFGTNSVTNNFYKYYNISKAQVAKYTGEEVQKEVSTKPSVDKNAITWDYQYDAEVANLQRILNQKGAKLHVDGKAGNNTYNACKKYTINKGDRGPLTQWVQQRLNTLGFGPLATDGIAGTATMRSISNFQKSAGQGTGYLGGKDWYFLIK